MFITPLVATTAEPLPPRGKWEVEYADSMCVLSRQYGSDANGPTLAIRPWPLSDRTEFALVEPAQRPSGPARTGSATVSIEPRSRSAKGSYVSWRLNNDAGRITTITVPNDKLGDLSDANSIALSSSGRPTVKVRSDAIGRAMTALRGCQDDLLRSWKIDPREPDLVATPATGDPKAKFITSNDYPAKALENSNIGTTVILWTISRDARVSDCRVVGQSGSPELDAAACNAMMTRGRYLSPAVGKDGKPMATHHSRRIVWRMP